MLLGLARLVEQGMESNGHLRERDTSIRSLTQLPGYVRRASNPEPKDFKLIEEHSFKQQEDRYPH